MSAPDTIAFVEWPAAGERELRRAGKRCGTRPPRARRRRSASGCDRVKVLGFDTATRATTVALLDSERDEAVERRDDPSPGARPRHTTRLMALVVEVLQVARRRLVGGRPHRRRGGPRAPSLGCESASPPRTPSRGRATSSSSGSRRCTPWPGARARAGRPPPTSVMAVIDARRGEVFAAGWAAPEVSRPDAAPLLRPRALAPDALAQAMAVGRSRVAGSGRRGGRIQTGSRACGSADSRAGLRAQPRQRHRALSAGLGSAA